MLSGICLGVPQRVLFECFLADLVLKKALKKHSVGHFPGRAPGHSCKWRPGSQTKSYNPGDQLQKIAETPARQKRRKSASESACPRMGCQGKCRKKVLRALRLCRSRSKARSPKDFFGAFLGTPFLMPKSPEREILAKFFADTGEKCGEKMAKFFADFRPSISRKSGRKKFHEKLATNSAGRKIKFFHRETLGVWGHNVSGRHFPKHFFGTFVGPRLRQSSCSWSPGL